MVPFPFSVRAMACPRERPWPGPFIRLAIRLRFFLHIELDYNWIICRSESTGRQPSLSRFLIRFFPPFWPASHIHSTQSFRLIVWRVHVFSEHRRRHSVNDRPCSKQINQSVTRYRYQLKYHHISDDKVLSVLVQRWWWGETLHATKCVCVCISLVGKVDPILVSEENFIFAGMSFHSERKYTRRMGAGVWTVMVR